MVESEKPDYRAKFKNTFLALSLAGAMRGPIHNSSRQIEKDVSSSTVTSLYFPHVVNNVDLIGPEPFSTIKTDQDILVSIPIATPVPILIPKSALAPISTKTIEGTKKAEVEEEVHRPIYRGNRNNPEVALTFDDGFSYQVIKKTLEVLEANNITGTFFVIGSQLRAYPDLWRQAAAAGHEICNHTYSHQYLASLSLEQIKKELVGWEEAAQEVLGEEYITRMKQEFAFVRFPGGSGHNDEEVLRAVTEAGYWPVAWSAETYAAVLKNYDLNNNPVAPIAQEVSNHIIGSSCNGTIILLHFNSWDTQYLDLTVKGLINKGLQPTTVSEVLK